MRNKLVRNFLFFLFLISAYCCNPKLYVINTKGKIYVGKPEPLIIDTNCAVLYGRVIDRYSMNVLPHSIVEISDNAGMTFSDSAGNFNFCLPSGEYYVKVISMGHKELRSKKLSLLSGEKLYLEFRMGSRVIIN